MKGERLFVETYWSYTHCSHSLCNAHHLREWCYCEELTGHFWPGELRRLLVQGKKAVAEARAAGQTAVEPVPVKELLTRYDQQVQNGLVACPVHPPAPGRKDCVRQHEATNLLLQLRDYKTQVWQYLTDWRVPFNNNLAERRVRPANRALGGSTAFCILRSVWETNKLNGINPFDTLRLVF
jgi:transposase